MPKRIDSSTSRRGALYAVLMFPAACLPLLSGCASTPAPARLRAVIAASPQLNPTPQGRAAPVVLRVFELKSAVGFEAASFVALFEHENEALGADLAGREEIVLKPGETRPLEKTLAPGTLFVGLVAAFRDLDHSTWRVTVPVKPGTTNDLQIRLDKLAVVAASPR